MKNWSLKIATSDYDDDDDDDDDNNDDNDYGYNDHYYSLLIIITVVVVYDQKMILARVLKMCQMAPAILARKGSNFQETAVVNEIIEIKSILLVLISCMDLSYSYIYSI